jgi:hypothetical protein
VASVAAIDPAAGVTGIDVTRGAGLTSVSASFAINSSGWEDLAANDYFQFGFSTTVPYLVEQFTVGLRSSNTGPGFVNLLYSKDRGASTKLGSVSPIELMGTTFNDLVASLTEIGVVNSSLVFRIVVDPAHPTNALFNVDPTVDPTIGRNGTFRFASYSPSDGVFVNPEITGSLVPEPASPVMGGIGFALVICAVARQARRVV